MYFVNTRKRLSSNTFLLHLLPAGAVFVTVLGLTLLGWRNAREAYRRERDNAVTQMVSQAQNDVTDRLESYELMLVGASGLFVSSDKVERGEWKQFVDSFRVSQTYPALQGVGFAKSETPGDLPKLVKQVRDEGYKNFRVFPAGTRSKYVIALYYEPSRASVMGYDMLSEPTRRAAIEQARITGESVISGKLTFVKNVNQFGSTGFTMYAPVYIKNTPPNSDPKARTVQGYVFAPVTTNKFFPVALAHTNQDKYAIRVYDTTATDQNLLYQSANFAALNTADAIRHTSQLTLFGRTWTAEYWIAPDIISQTTRNRPLSSLLVGTMLSLLLSGFVLSLLIARTRVLAHTKQTEVQSAKDELLSLASHQLRTPATSVKQYLGMALEGFGGKLTPQQNSLLEKAFESNERQLHIINEILYVAKIDAKGIVLTPRRINANKLLRELVQELSAIAKKSGQKIRLQMPKRQSYITADEHCLRMALENLISNGLKYSHEGSTVSVKMASSSKALTIRVRDRGVGIDHDDLSLLFQRFSRIPNELSRQTSGSGIGLYLSQQLIELHHGTIEVASTKGKGTTFTVFIPKNYDKKDKV